MKEYIQSLIEKAADADADSMEAMRFAQAALNAANALVLISPKPSTKEEIKTMVDNFLNWELPENFNPDGGIIVRVPRPRLMGTNLLDATQAEKMVRHMLGMV